ncbi:MAG: BTB/POZ domain-containing protein, partial [Acidobacteria bacterium]|nr:BTB/POZ domain-containing protein [Acidobacteriota bacterium]
MHIRDVALSKFHSAVLTNDAVSNLYVCGLGRGGRLGLGDENTKFRFVPVQGPLSGRRVSQVALGQYHTLAVVGNGELWSWGSNAVCQLGYPLPTPTRADEEPVSLTPRQVFGPLRKEIITGVAASAVHSVAHSSSSLYCWGRNLGQLGLMDADSRSLEVQSTPRKVAGSLISTPILMISAIDKATTCLLASNTLFVFTSYGYNIVKFPAPDIFVNTRLGASTTLSQRNLNKIKAITSGGEAIAALSARGDLFLMNLNHHVDTMSATSTTNPAKIKRGAVSQAQCIWSARKEGVTSFGIGEHGSVIISTESGAVWRRVTRTKAKNAAAPGSDEIKRKDFKFQRVPGITNAVTVRSSAFGAFAAVRRDRTSVAERIKVTDQTLWEDLSTLYPLGDFESVDPDPASGNTKYGKKFWDSEVEKKKIGQTAYQVLKSPDLESDLALYLDMLASDDSGFDAVVSTTSAPDLKIPVHEWVLGARSTVLRKAFATFQDDGVADIPEVVNIESDEHGQTSLTFYGLDIVSLLNLVLYAYRDEVVPVWNYLREVPHMSFRYRQVRVELMKLATRLNMMKLEAAARLQSRITKSLDEDFKLAVQDNLFLESGDALLELDGVELPVHSYLLRQRCPFFYGLFEGRSQGQWVAGRLEDQEDEERVRVDLGHFDPRAFRYVLLHLYADVGLELFDETVSADVDDFSELVMDVMSMANELMLDRLSQVCQQVISRFVTARNISHLLNEISPCSVQDFKDAGLEYAALHMEMMLENHLLDDLDDDLTRELDDIVRGNQLARAPFSRSGRAEMLLHERYPELAEDIEEERRRRAREVGWKAAHRDDERKVSLSYRTRFGSFDDGLAASPTPDKSRRKSRAANVEMSTPPLRAQASQGDMIFSMDEDALECPESPSLRPANRGALKAREVEPGSFKSVSQKKRQPLDLWGSAQSPSAPTNRDRPDAKAGSPWGTAPLPVDKLDLHSILSEESTTPGPSGIAASLEAQKGKEKATPTRLSQKERKRQQQLEASQRMATDLTVQEQPRKAWDAQAEA